MDFSLRTALSESLRYAIPGIGHTLKISWRLILGTVVLLAAFIAAVGFIFGFDELGSKAEYSTSRMALDIGSAIIGLLFSAAFLTVVARDQVLKESPARLLPAFWGVFLRYFIITLIAFGLIIALVFVATAIFIGIADAFGTDGRSPINEILVSLMPLVGLLMIGYLISRFITWAASYAVDRPQTFGEAWRATAGITGWKILAGMIALVVLVIIAALALVFLIWAPGYALLNQASDVAAVPIGIIFGIAVLLLYWIFATLLTIFPVAVFTQLARS